MAIIGLCGRNHPHTKRGIVGTGVVWSFRCHLRMPKQTWCIGYYSDVICYGTMVNVNMWDTPVVRSALWYDGELYRVGVGKCLALTAAVAGAMISYHPYLIVASL